MPQRTRNPAGGDEVPDYSSTENQERIASIAIAQRNRSLGNVGQPLPLADPDDTYNLRVAVHQEAKQRGIVTMGALGDVKRVISAIPRELIMPNPLHPRDNWREVDTSMRQLCAVMDSMGQQQRLLATTLDPGDPNAANFRVVLIDGHRQWRAAELNMEPSTLEVETIDHADGRPLTPSEMLEWYLLGNLMFKQLTMEQLVRGYACYAEVAEAEGKRVTLSPTELAERYGLNKSTTSRVAGILNEPPEIRHAVVSKLIQPTLVIQLWGWLPNRTSRLQCVLRLIEINEARIAGRLPRLTIEEARREAQNFTDDVLALPAPQGVSSYRELVQRHGPIEGRNRTLAAALSLDAMAHFLQAKENDDDVDESWESWMATMESLVSGNFIDQCFDIVASVIHPGLIAQVNTPLQQRFQSGSMGL